VGKAAWPQRLRQHLKKTLDEEKATDKKLTTLAESKVNLRAAS
jgi:ferritin-like metal-binding protein YciE